MVTIKEIEDEIGGVFSAPWMKVTKGKIVFQDGTTPKDVKEFAWISTKFLVADIKKWDTEDAEYLLTLLSDLRTYAEYLGHKIEELVDLSSLPSEPFPEKISTYPVWAVDKQGMALVGATCDEIEELESIMESYNE